MSEDKQFERRLKRQPMRPAPPEWRAEILSAARQAANSRPTNLIARSSSLCSLRSQLAALLWPYPRAWAALAAVWLLALGLHLANREPSWQSLVHQATRPSPQMREMLLQQELMLAELIGPREQPQRPKSAVTQPRSQRRDEFLNA